VNNIFLRFASVEELQNNFEAIRYESILKFQDYFNSKKVEKNMKKQIKLSVTDALPLIEGRHTAVANTVTEVVKSY
jgi:hypothetical protein